MYSLMHLIQLAKQLAWRLSPHHRRIQAKRHLERLILDSGLLREYSTSDRKRAARIANLAFPHPSRKDKP